MRMDVAKGDTLPSCPHTDVDNGKTAPPSGRTRPLANHTWAATRTRMSALAAAAVFIANASHADTSLLPVESRIVPDTAFAIAEDAALAALQIALPLSSEHEFGGAVVKCGGWYYYTQPVSNGRPDVVHSRIRVDAGCILAGIYHTHPPRTLDHFFSADDIDNAKRHGVRSFMGVVRLNEIRVFDPATMRGWPNARYEQYGPIARGAKLTYASASSVEKSTWATAAAATSPARCGRPQFGTRRCTADASQ